MSIDNRKTQLISVNGCLVTGRTADNDFGFATHVVKINNKNLIGFEFNGNYQLRIDVINAENEANFLQMMKALVKIAKCLNYTKLFYAGKKEEEIRMLITFGFDQIDNDGYNTFLCLNLKKETENDI